MHATISSYSSLAHRLSLLTEAVFAKICHVPSTPQVTHDPLHYPRSPPQPHQTSLALSPTRYQASLVSALPAAGAPAVVPSEASGMAGLRLLMCALSLSLCAACMSSSWARVDLRARAVSRVCESLRDAVGTPSACASMFAAAWLCVDATVCPRTLLCRACPAPR